MATPIGSFSHQQRIAALDTYTYTIQNTGLHLLKARAFIPSGSGLTVTIKQNGTTIATSPAPTANQSMVFLQAADVVCTAADVISFVVASSNAIDQATNAVLANLSIALTGNPN